MSAEHPAAPLLDGVALLERAIGYTLGSLRLVTPDAMTRPSPCRAWDLRALLRHMNDSLEALHEGAALGAVGLDDLSEYVDPVDDPVAALRNRACRMLGAWTNAGGRNDISIADQLLPPSILTSAGALEVAVHGWDVARACGYNRPIPEALAEELLELAPALVTEADRATRFAAPVAVSPRATPSERLIAFLGR